MGEMDDAGCDFLVLRLVEWFGLRRWGDGVAQPSGTVTLIDCGLGRVNWRDVCVQCWQYFLIRVCAISYWNDEKLSSYSIAVDLLRTCLKSARWKVLCVLKCQ